MSSEYSEDPRSSTWRPTEGKEDADLQSDDSAAEDGPPARKRESVSVSASKSLGFDDSVRSATTPSRSAASAPSGGDSRFRTEFRREANDNELRLNVLQEANALSHVFQTANGEFCFGLFGRWGRGKTTLMRRLQDRLTDPETDRFKNYVKYDTVTFSAWKYRTVPELWIYLYESFADAVSRTGFRSSLSTIFRCSLIRYGFLPLIVSVLLFAFCLTPIGDRIHFVTRATQVISAAGAMFLLSLYTSAKGSGLILNVRRYATLPRHREKLGLQAAIGDDLIALLKAWIPCNEFKDYRGLIGTLLLLVAIAALLVALFLRLRLFMPFHLVWPPLVLGWLLFVWMILVVLHPFALHSDSKSKRLLLCVDDLDRCEQNAMLEIIESLKLFLDDDEINSRLQVIFLVDRRILNIAILRKYGMRFEERLNAGESMRPQWVIRENLEKCFSAHFEMQPLRSNDLKGLSEAYMGTESFTSRDATTSSIEEGDVQFSEIDRNVIVQAMSRDSEKASGSIDVGPRRLRYLLCQYQVGKLLLRERGAALSQEVLGRLAQALAATMFEEDASVYDGQNRDLEIVLQQVSDPITL